MATRLLIGTYTNDGRSSGIYSLAFDAQSGALGEPVLAAATPNPTFLALTSDHTHVLATSECLNSKGEKVGGLRSFKIVPEQSELVEISSQPISSNGGSTHVAITPDAHTALVVHYNASWVASLGLDSEGALQSLGTLVFHEGKTGPDSKRQDRPHPHSTTISPDGRHAYICDLGMDLIKIYGIDGETHRLNFKAEATTPAGAGPRHARFSRDGHFFYGVNELSGTLSHYECDPLTGELTLKETVSLLPEGFSGVNTSAEIQIHPNGRFVYATSRGPDIITCLERTPSTGALRVIQRIPSGGQHPRHFAVSPDGHWLVCANRDSDSINVFSVDSGDGHLTATSISAVVPQAVCVLFAP